MDTHKSANTHPSIIFSIFLLILLLFPFCLKLLLTEPYPAVIFPSGAGTVDLSDQSYNFTEYRVYGISDQGPQQRIDILKLITPAHPQYLYQIFGNAFGLSADPTKELKLRGTDWTLLSYRQRGATDTQRAECKSWLNARLEQRYQSLILQKIIVTGDLKTRSRTNEQIDDTIEITL